MKNDHFVESSRRIYAGLLNLYPREHCAEYGPDMLQVFTDQCRRSGGGEMGLRRALHRLGLWVRTLLDLLANVVKEHITAPNASIGLLEAPPNAPLPWKGVALVLIPGLIFFISQIGQLTGVDWFYWMMYRGAYFMILPVLAVWIWKRKFPIWGLIPLGLLYRTLSIAGYRSQFLSAQSWVLPINDFARSFHTVLPIAIITSVVLGSIFLLWLVRRRSGIPGRAWAWLGMYALLALVDMLTTAWDYITINGMDWRAVFFSSGGAAYRVDMIQMMSFGFYNYGGFLVLILLGALLARRHGRLAMLLPLGYLLSSIIYGRVSNDWPGLGTREFSFMLTVALAALAYRFTVALAGPLWIVRSASGKMQTRAGAVSLLFLIGIQAAFNVWLLFYYGWSVVDWTNLYSMFADQVILGVGVGLALALYGEVQIAQRERLKAQAVFN